MINILKERIADSETYRLFKSAGVRRAWLHLWPLIRDHWRTLFFINVEGYIAEVDLTHFVYSERYRQNIEAQGMEFHHLKQGESLPDFSYGITQLEIERRLAAGHLCYSLKHEGQVVCSLWIGSGRINYSGNSVYLYSDHTAFTLSPYQAWYYDSICHPQYRGKGLSTGLKNEALFYAKEMGVTSVLATVGLDNIANIKAMFRTGFRMKEKVLFRRYFLFQSRKKQILSDSDNAGLKLQYHV